MSNILFVTCNNIKDEKYGGGKASIRNYKCLSYNNTVHLLYVKRINGLSSILSILTGYFPPSNSSYLKEIKTLVKKNKIDVVFFDQSFFGKFIHEVKILGCKAVVFCHNCESDYIKIRFMNSKSLKRALYQYLVDRNEKRCISEADSVAVFNDRDKRRIELLYNRIVDDVISLGIEDTTHESILSNKNETTQNSYCLILCPASDINIFGIRWFVQYVTPNLDCNVLIAGKGMEKYAKEFTNEKIQVIGEIDDVEPIYRNAFVVAVPQLKGAGMKVKVAEALMFGKFIVGTEEAFMGYDLDYKLVGGKTDNPQEFSELITHLQKQKRLFNNYSRNMFIEKYSMDSAKEKLNRLVSVDL